MRSRLRLLTVVLLATAALAACGNDDGDGEAGSSDTYRVEVTTPDDGDVVLTTRPERIAALNGGRVIPFLLPFLGDGVEVVGYGGDATTETHPWIAEQLDGLPNSVDAEGPTLEAYASWRPDLMIANGNLGDYWEPAREVGPLVQLPETDWRATTTLLGEIFERPDVAEETIAATEALIDVARLAEPVSAAVVSPYADNGTVGFQVLGAELPNFLADLGVEVAPSETADGGYEDVSLELLAERLDVDWVIVVNNGDELQADFLADPLVSSLPVFAEGRFVALDEVQSTAGFPVTPPSIPVVLDALAPILDGPPAS